MLKIFKHFKKYIDHRTMVISKVLIEKQFKEPV